ncbi:dephospho-CoA kinase-domain-containing protein [Pelagophyceae sp. CCMP2097]|nr:dephospho-CoA kinase-domain-containing protein [Pelagophyceae sp. CCMP2097]
MLRTLSLPWLNAPADPPAHARRRARPRGSTFVVGLTGGIATGKTTVAKWFRECGITVDDADAAVHAMYKAGGDAVAPLRDRFSNVVLAPDGSVDRRALSGVVFGDDAALRDVERIVHPLVAAARARAVAAAVAANEPLIVTDIPLLFECGLASECHVVATTAVDAPTQRTRLLARPSMSSLPDGGLAKCDALLNKQCTDEFRREHADVIWDTSSAPSATRAEVHAFVDDCRRRHALEQRPPPPGRAVAHAAAAGAAVAIFVLVVSRLRS